ncbi:MAG: redoxin family protein [Phycisphaerae bacterium]
MRSLRTTLIVLAVSALLTGSARAGLKVGDPAPAFTVTEWLKGAPEDLASAKGKKIFVIDFWATWCMPCLQDIPKLSRLQEQYRKDNVVFIGLTSPVRGQQLSQVKNFLRTRGQAMQYTVAWDKTQTMWRTYLDGAGAMGIPYLFVVDKQGRIAWHGHPTPDFERVLGQLIDGTFDVQAEALRAEREAKVNALLPKYANFARLRQWDQGLGILNQILAIDPTHENAMTEAYFLQIRELQGMDQARDWVRKFIEANANDPLALIALARVLLGVDRHAERAPDLMLRAAKAAFDATKGHSISAVRIYARAAYTVGHLDAAIRLQTQAVEMASGDLKPRLAKSLEYYQICKSLRDTQFQFGAAPRAADQATANAGQ